MIEELLYDDVCSYQQNGITCSEQFCWKCNHERIRNFILFSQGEIDPIAEFNQSVAEYYGFDEE